jgi:hypothetical protein
VQTITHNTDCAVHQSRQCTCQPRHTITLPKCHAAGCTDDSDPRYAIHGPDGAAVPACDGCGGSCTGNPCTCPPHNGEVGPKPAWQAAMDRRAK